MRNKHKIISLILAFVFVFSGFAYVFAEENEEGNVDRSSRTSEQTVNKETKDQNSDDLKTKRLNLARKRNVKSLMATQVARTEKMINRLGVLIQKTEARRDKMAAEGLTITKINQLIDTAKAKKTAAEAALADAKSKYQSFDASTTDLKKLASDFMAAMKELRIKLKDLHTAIKNVAREMKAVVKADKDAQKSNEDDDDQDKNENETEEEND